MQGLTRRLILMRHAKSAWNSEGLSDHERLLNARGRRDAPRIADALREQDWSPDAVFSSTSTRTRQTWARMQSAFEQPVTVTFLDAFYLAGLGALQDSVPAWNDSWRTVLCLGHNPGWQHAVSELTGVPTGMTTANAALMTCQETSWSQAMEAAWTLVALIRPKEL
jgi:phosphohistidine phosphatase